MPDNLIELALEVQLQAPSIAFFVVTIVHKIIQFIPRQRWETSTANIKIVQKFF